MILVVEDAIIPLTLHTAIICPAFSPALQGSRSKWAYTSGVEVCAANTRGNNAIDARNLGSHSFLGEENFKKSRYPNSQPFYWQMFHLLGGGVQPANPL